MPEHPELAANAVGPVLQEAHRETPPTASDPLLVPRNEQVDYLNLTRPARTINERREKRIVARNMKACIRSASTEDVVEVVNISRRGLCFCSWSHYLPGTIVEVAAPFTIGSNNIFQPAKIVRAQRRAVGAVPGEYALMMLERQ